MPIAWRPIQEFPDYSVSSTGLVQNTETGHRMALLVNQHGIVNVGLNRRGVQYKRGVALLVARAFVEGQTPSFDCVINLDGDRRNNCAENLAWRPKWFAVEYFRQMNEGHFDDYYPIEDVFNHKIYYNPWVAATDTGILQRDVLLSICNNTEVWPTRQRFRKVDYEIQIPAR